jgi:hypothetical protein
MSKIYKQNADSLLIKTVYEHSDKRGIELDPWLLYVEPVSGRRANTTKVNKNKDEFTLMTLRLSCPFQEYDFGCHVVESNCFDPPTGRVIAVSDPISTKTIMPSKLKKTADYFCVDFWNVRTEPIYDYDEAVSVLFKVARKLKPYWMTLKLPDVRVVHGVDGLPNQKEHETQCREIIKLTDYPILTNYTERFDANPDEFETDEELYKHYLGDFRSLIVAGKYIEDEGDYEEVYLDIPDDQMDAEYQRLKQENAKKLKQISEFIIEQFLSEIRKEATDEQIQKWLNKILNFKGVTLKSVGSLVKQMNENHRKYFDLFCPTKISVDGEIFFEDGSM